MALLISATAEVIMLHRDIISSLRDSISTTYWAVVTDGAGNDAAVVWLVELETTVGVVEAIEPSESYLISVACCLHGRQLLAVAGMVGVAAMEKFFFRISA